MEKLVFQVSEETEGERLDKYLAAFVEGFSRSYLQKLIADGRLVINRKGCTKSSVTVKSGDEIVLEVPENVIPKILPENIPLDILYEDEDVIVVNKPKGMVVHPAAGHYEGTLVNALLYHCGDSLSGINGVLRPGIVHRIDKDTTGSVIACKNDMAHRFIADELKEHRLIRKYECIVHGVFKEEEGTVSTLIGRDPKNRLKMAVIPSGGKDAVTHYRVLRTFREYSHVECVLETGRTHQIRVHMAHIGHPILGDPLYCGLKSRYHTEGQCLHAGILGFPRPKDKKMIMTKAPLPDYFSHLLSILP
ncbi:MAG: RluA family pseudouridine synthase [Lachnospiraceae bacterium]|nr:RluA family pseudouridine synthase [Lachnospiraceae bacterium]